ncbi:lysozyme inhibitor LprI family protein [Erythrobacter colymbi]|uniref:lysozyme inhibitor LprI family protein n=1 Tax=Erythrobacter colymbi TaxID=1161202 RepID=UPI000A3CF2A4|nr:lysozyme inhibitor LprI family protein [Erythrobacter colymbi]
MRDGYLLLITASLLFASCAREEREPVSLETAVRAATTTPYGESEDCADTPDNVSYRECFTQLAVAVRAEVDTELAKARKLVEAADEEYSHYQPESLTADDKTQLARHLVMSQENWLRYVDGQCELEATAARGGSGTDTLRQKCLLRLARLRLAELRGAEALIDGNR